MFILSFIFVIVLSGSENVQICFYHLVIFLLPLETQLSHREDRDPMSVPIVVFLCFMISSERSIVRFVDVDVIVNITV